ncbi:MAG: hypothetical protein JL50_16645 [Peptococcaceae bacterium BICA1-7]|nr:MAG: hypothetical protein JL50_16645 [Peptococcaceae bacterium BICA1-7]HBV96578.1 hypothetical protein [Desulfotomaculum sp.]
MKIGAGGLQALIAQEAAKAVEAKTVKTPAEQELIQTEDPELRKQIYQLNKAAERMRKAAEMFNQPLEFKVKLKDKKKPRISARDRRTGAEKDYTLQEAEAWLEEVKENRGRVLNGYV